MDNPRSACPEIIYAFDQNGDPTVKLELVSASSNWDCKITFGGVKCHYSIENENWTPGFFEYTQLIKVYDEEAPAIEAPDSTFCAYGTPSEDPATCYGPVKLPFTAMDNCPSNIAEVKKVELLVNRNPSTVLTAASGLFEVVRGEGNNWTIEGNLPVGKHQFVVSIMDGCGNIAGEEIDFEVIDCKAPAPVCKGLTAELMPVDTTGDGQADTGMNTVWATDFIASEVSDCSGEVTYSVNWPGEAPAPDKQNLIVDCSRPVGEVLAVEVYAWDEAGNRDMCETFIILEDNLNTCEGGSGGSTASIAGRVFTEAEIMVAGVDVQLSGALSEAYQTGDDGQFTFTSLVEGNDYTLRPRLDEQPLNGVSTFDLVLISKHILSVQQLDSPYKLIAADVNRSGKITTLDIIQLRRLILSIDTEFSNNTSWRFIPADHQFANPNDPWAEGFPEVRNYSDLVGQLQSQNFIALKIGDVNGNAVANALMAEDRDVAGTFEINVDDQQMIAGNEYKVSFTAADLANVAGYQFTLNYDRAAAELMNIEYGVASKEHFGIFPNEGVITTSWNGEASDEVLFTLVFRANTDAEVSEVLSVGSRYTTSEAYTEAGELMDVALNFGATQVTAAEFKLHQNQPNPFNGITTIRYELPEAAQATITVKDVSGRVLRVIEQDGVKGANQVDVKAAGLPAGVLFYTVETAEHTATKKMIIME